MGELLIGTQGLRLQGLKGRVYEQDMLPVTYPPTAGMLRKEPILFWTC